MDNSYISVYDYTFRQLTAFVASDAPTPGGGSISALAGALGIALAAMVGNITVGKNQDKDLIPEIESLTGNAYYIINKLEKLAEADIAAFGQFIETSRMSKNTEEEKEKRLQSMQQALKSATEIPLAMARTLLSALEITGHLATLGSKTVLSDAGAAAYLCEGALNAALLNVDINLPLIKDTEFLQKNLVEKEQLLKEGVRLKEKALSTVRERMGS